MWYEERNRPHEAQIARWCIARTLRSLGRLHEAFTMQADLRIEIENSANEPDGYVYEELGECAILLNKSQKEIADYFKKAYTLLSCDINFTATESERLSRIKKISETE